MEPNDFDRSKLSPKIDSLELKRHKKIVFYISLLFTVWYKIDGLLYVIFV